MSAQMTLIEHDEKKIYWVLDRQTREVGLRGVAAARMALKANRANSNQAYKAQELLLAKIHQGL